MNTERQRYLKRGGASKVGHRQRQALRLSRVRTEVTSLDLMRWTFPRLGRGQWREHHWFTMRRAAGRYWARCGHLGRYLLWRAKSEG